MLKELDENNKYWHRLTDALHILSVHLNVPLRLLYYDADARMESLWRRNHNAKPDKHPPVPLDELLALVAAPVHPAPLDEEIDPALLYWLCPLPPAHGQEPGSAIERLDETIYQAIYEATPPLSNPFHAQLKDYFPTLRARIRLDCLRRLSRLPSGDDVPIVFDSPTGMSGMFYRLAKGRVLLVGPVWLEERLPESSDPLSARRERKICEILEKLQDIDGEDDRRCSIEFEQRAHLLQLATAYPSSNVSDLKAKGQAAYQTITCLLDNLEREKRKEDISLHAAEWLELSRFVLFWHMPPIMLIERGEIERWSRDDSWPTPMVQRGNRLSFAHPLSTRRDRTVVTKLGLDVAELSYRGGNRSQLRFEITDDEKYLRETVDASNFLLSARFDLAHWEAGKSAEGLSKIASDRYRSFLAEGYASESHLSRIFDARLDYMLQHQPFSDIAVRLKYMVKRARLLVGGDVADYLHYNGPEDLLEPGALDRRTALKAESEEEERKWEEDIKTDLSRLFDKCAGDPEKRKKSSAYRALDNRMLVSRFTAQDNEERIAQFTKAMTQEVLMTTPEARDRLVSILRRMLKKLSPVVARFPDEQAADDLYEILGNGIQDWHTFGQLYSPDREQLELGLLTVTSMKKPMPEALGRLQLLRQRYQSDADLLPKIVAAIDAIEQSV